MNPEDPTTMPMQPGQPPMDAARFERTLEQANITIQVLEQQRNEANNRAVQLNVQIAMMGRDLERMQAELAQARGGATPAAAGPVGGPHPIA